MSNFQLDRFYANPPTGQQTFVGIPFAIGQNGNNAVATDDGNSGSIYGSTHSIPVGRVVDAVFIVLDGMSVTVADALVGRVTLQYDTGEAQSLDLLAGVNIRDWVQCPDHPVIHSVTAPYVQQVWGGDPRPDPAWVPGTAVLDMLTLPADKSRRLLAITVEDLNADAGTFVSAVTVQLAPGETTTIPSAAPNPAFPGQAVTLGATVTPVPDGGTIEFLADGISLGTVPVGQTLQRAWQHSGAHQIEARFSGTANYHPSSGTVTVEVLPDGVWHRDPANGHLYRLTDQRLSWKDARRQAVLWGGMLATVNDQAEQDWLVQTFGNDEDMHIGLRDVLAGTGKWRWETGDAVGYLNWASGQPGDTTLMPCVAQGKGLAGAWMSVPMDYMARGIVERVPPHVQVIDVPPDGSTVTTEPLETGTRYVIEASGVWRRGDGPLGDAAFVRHSDGTWSSAASLVRRRRGRVRRRGCTTRRTPSRHRTPIAPSSPARASR